MTMAAKDAADREAVRTRKRLLDVRGGSSLVRCEHCDELHPRAFCDVDHKVRRVDGGTHSASNMQTLCRRCHAAKTAMERALAPARDPSRHAAEKVNALLAQRSEQAHREYSLAQVRDWFLDGVLLRAPHNRLPVWDTRKQADFVLSVLSGRAIPPIYVNRLADVEETRHVYDGVNRMHALMQFMGNRLHVTLRDGFVAPYRTVVRYSGDGCQLCSASARCVALDAAQRRRFEAKMLSFFEWEALPEDEACHLAQQLNVGTPMTTGERVLLLLGLATPRACALRMLSELPAVEAIRARLHDREKTLKVLAQVARRVLDPQRPHESRYARFETLRHFYESPDPVDTRDVQRAVDACETAAGALATRRVNDRLWQLALRASLLTHCDVVAVLRDEGAMDDEDALLAYHTARPRADERAPLAGSSREAAAPLGRPPSARQKRGSPP